MKNCKPQSELSFYRVLKAAGLDAHRSWSNPASSKKPKELVATSPNQVYSWDSTCNYSENFRNRGQSRDCPRWLVYSKRLDFDRSMVEKSISLPNPALSAVAEADPLVIKDWP